MPRRLAGHASPTLRGIPPRSFISDRSAAQPLGRSGSCSGSGSGSCSGSGSGSGPAGTVHWLCGGYELEATTDLPRPTYGATRPFVLKAS